MTEVLFCIGGYINDPKHTLNCPYHTYVAFHALTSDVWGSRDL